MNAIDVNDIFYEMIFLLNIKCTLHIVWSLECLIKKALMLRFAF